MRFSAVTSPTCTIPSTPSATCTNAPNFWMLVTGPSTTEPTGNFFAASTHGSPSACFRPSEIRRSGAFTPSTTTSTVSPGFTTSAGLRIFLDQDISERCTRPSMPFSSSTNAPKSVTRVTLPFTRSPTLYLSATRSQGCGCSCLSPSEIRFLAGSTFRIRASTLSPTLSTSAGLLTRPHEMSATCSSASTPPISTKAP